ncbi:MAG: alcohol dehydrogenase catalytic domain-containing protein [Candidatus Hydrogenedens sp.]|nr:alcohol dehydrogenase catalytic domain-containing protein [Candidatus Hydrogenedens sp.]
MKALYLDNGEALVRQVPKPEPRPGEALIKVLAAGVCSTDLELVRGYMDYRGVLGHEFVGVVHECANDYLRGKRVVGEINCVCHECRYCKLEMPHHCERRTVLGILGRDGAFAEYLTLPEENLHVVPDTLDDDVAVFTEPVAAAFRILEQIDITARDSVVVLGDGKLGQLIAQVLAMRAPNLVCVGRQAWKLALLQARGIRTARADEPLESGASIVVEATGSEAGFARALELLRPEGTLVLKTTIAGASLLPMALPVINEIKIIGSRCGPFRPALEALAMGSVYVEPMVTETYPLAEAAHALQRAASKDTMKVLLRM